MLTQVHGQNIALRKFVDAILDESRAHHKDPTMPIPLPHTTSEAPPPAPEPWVPKADQMAVVTRRVFLSESQTAMRPQHSSKWDTLQKAKD